MFYCRNLNDALIRSGCDSSAKVHLHIDEVIDDVYKMKIDWQIEILSKLLAEGEISRDKLVNEISELQGK